MSRRVPLLCAAVVGLAPISAQAGLVVYEGFNYAASSQLNGQGTGTGWAAGSTWSTYSAPGTSGTTADATLYTTTSSGLSFSNLLVTGKAATSTVTVAAAGVRNQIAGRQFESGSTLTGTVWESFLVKIADGTTNAAGSRAEVRVGQAANDNANGTNSFRVNPLQSGGSEAAAVAYDNGQTVGSAFSPTRGTTYLTIAKYTNVGSTLSGAITGEASMWVLTETQYNAIKSGGVTEVELNGVGAVATKVTDPAVTSGSYSLNSKYAQLNSYLTANFGGSATLTNTFDELRFGVGADPTTAGILPSAAANFARLVASGGGGTAYGPTAVDGNPATSSYKIGETAVSALVGHVTINDDLANGNASPYYAPVYVLLDINGATNSSAADQALVTYLNGLAGKGYDAFSIVGAIDTPEEQILAAYLNGVSGDYDVLLKFGANPASAGSFQFDYDFSGSDITALGVTSLNYIGVVPEPSGVAILTLGGLAAFAGRRRRK